MKKMISIALVFIACTSCNQQTETDTKAEGEKLMKTSREWSHVAASKNADSILRYLTDDAVVLSPGEAPLKGKNAIRGMVEGSFKTPGLQISWEPESAEISKSGDMGYLLENTTMKMTDSLGKASVQNFKAVTI